MHVSAYFDPALWSSSHSRFGQVIATRRTGRGYNRPHQSRTSVGEGIVSMRALSLEDGTAQPRDPIETEEALRKRVEAALRESEERYHGLFEGVPVGLYRTT